MRGLSPRFIYINPHALHNEDVPHGPGLHVVEIVVLHRVQGNFWRDITRFDLFMSL
jgi:hypothetical protein